MKAPARVIIDNETSSNYSIIEVNCKNAPGVLYMITKSTADQVFKSKPLQFQHMVIEL